MSYHIRYTIEPGQFKKEDATKDQGLTDSIFITSIVKGDNGGINYMFIGLDGKTNQVLTDDEIFKIWTALTSCLADSQKLSPYQKNFCNDVFQSIRMAMGFPPN